jgi:DnaJ-class molecular chaperone
MSTLYQNLGLSPGANGQQIKSAYRTLAKQFHPDVNVGNEASARRFKEINRAHETLGDPAAKAAYDLALARQRGRPAGAIGPSL